jgi:N-formylglutamate deformylase
VYDVGAEPRVPLPGQRTMSPPLQSPRPDAFVSQLAQPPRSPVVVSVPHAGIATDGFDEALAPGLDVRSDADLFVDELYQPACPSAFVRARLSRFVCDLNRHPDDVSALAVPTHPAPRNIDGRGFLWEVTTTGARALARPLSMAEWEERRAIHTAYHEALADALARARSRFGFAILIDGHSMPSVGRSGHTDSGRQRADIVPGDKLGTSCAPALSRLVGDHFHEHGLRVAFNDPYRGGFITTHHGHPSEGVHAIQIEMRRDLYMDEATLERRPEKMATLSAVLAALLVKLEGLQL